MYIKQSKRGVTSTMTTRLTSHDTAQRSGSSNSRSSTGSKSRGQSISPPLATPSFHESAEVQAIVEAVNPIIADSFALYVKTKNFHWHLSGREFRDLHLLFDEQSQEILGTIDVMAERLRKIGGTTIRSIGHIAQVATIEDDDEQYVEPLSMVQRL